MTTERQRMLAGELYDPRDPELVALRERARSLCRLLDDTQPAQRVERRRLCTELFGSGGDTVSLEPPFRCDYGPHIHLGANVYFNFNCVVLDVCEVRIGEHTLFGSGVQILTPLHPLDARLRRTREFGKPVNIGADVWVGAGALILAGVSVGSRTVIGAGSVVTRDLPDDVFAAGNPCRVIKGIS